MSTSSSNCSANSSSCKSASPTQQQSLKLYQVVIFATPVLFGIILVLLFIMFYLRRRRIRSLNSRVRAQFLAGALFSPPHDQGLSKSFRQRLPVFPYDESYAASTEYTQCAVCLDEYEVGEKIQQLPGCGHAFHAGCIDEWLASNFTCPICRMCVLQVADGKLYMSDFSTPPSVSAAGGDSSNTESRRWEERILSEAQDNHIRRDGSRGSSSNDIDTSLTADTALRVLTIEHSINIERI